MPGEANADAVDTQSLAETPDHAGAFPRLDEYQIQELSREGFRRPTEAGEVLYREGDASCDFIVILSGKVKIVEGFGSGQERTIGVHGPGRFLGELNLLTGEAVFVTAVVAEPGEVLIVPVERLREVVARNPGLGDVILRAYLQRRSLLIGLGSGLRIIGSRYSPDTKRIREFATRNRLPHRWIDLERDAAAEALMRTLGIRPEDVEVVPVATAASWPMQVQLIESLGHSRLMTLVHRNCEITAWLRGGCQMLTGSNTMAAESTVMMHLPLEKGRLFDRASGAALVGCATG